MWCPLGYVHFHKIEEAIEIAARRIVPRQRGHELVFLDDAKEEFNYEKSNEFRRLVVAGKILELFLHENRYSACAATLSGQVVRLSGHVVRPVIFNHWTCYEKQFSRRLALLYIEISTAKIDVYGVAKRFSDWKGDDGYYDVATIWQNDAVSDLGELNGWVVCYPENEIQLSVEKLIELWDNHIRQDSDDSSKLGRPRRQEDAAQMYDRLYPGGHGNATWKEVINKLDAAGVSVSLKTLQRALEKKQELNGPNPDNSASKD